MQMLHVRRIIDIIGGVAADGIFGCCGLIINVDITRAKLITCLDICTKIKTHERRIERKYGRKKEGQEIKDTPKSLNYNLGLLFTSNYFHIRLTRMIQNALRREKPATRITSSIFEDVSYSDRIAVNVRNASQ